jgi:hypothetical protein
MSQKQQNIDDDVPDPIAVHPTRMRRAPSKRPSRVHKSRRKPASPSGIHRRANKRMGW